MFRNTIVRFGALLAVLALAACGNSNVPVVSAPSPAAIPTRAGAPTRAVAAATTAAPAASAAPAAIPEGRTPEGYHVLGQANAPVTLVMYSDFL